MSDAYAEVFDGVGNLVGYSVYHGSSDNVSPDISETIEEAFEIRHRFFGKESGWDRRQRCEHEGDDGFVYSHYGRGFGWDAEICLECGVILGELSPYPPEEVF